jgi:HPt (histidine-containing phosphotransfer) domain-containing protein
MMTLDTLKLYGANTAEGMGRCLNNESFYLKMVAMALADKNFDKLKEAVDAGDIHAAFEAAHALKGSIGNVALTPIFEPICALTELLRGQDALVAGADTLTEAIMAAREKALTL